MEEEWVHFVDLTLGSFYVCLTYCVAQNSEGLLDRIQYVRLNIQHMLSTVSSRSVHCTLVYKHKFFSLFHNISQNYTKIQSHMSDCPKYILSIFPSTMTSCAVTVLNWGIWFGRSKGKVAFSVMVDGTGRKLKHWIVS